MTQTAKPRCPSRPPDLWKQRWRAAAVALLMTVQPLAVPVGAVLTAPAAPAPLAIAATAAVSVAFVPDEAQARAGSRGGRSSSSGGYSRPSRTPSVGSSSGYSRPSAPRTPSTGSSGGGWFSGGSSSSSGGYARPGSSAPSVAAPPTSAGDRTFSQQGSADALNRYRTRQEADRTPPAAPPPAASTQGRTGNSSSSGGSGWGWGWGSGGSSYRTPSTRPAPANPYGQYGWNPPPYAYSAPRRFGIWDGLFLWFMLDTLTRPGHASFFHNNADDPGYREWRQEADRLARDNAELRAKLDQLDQSVAAQAGTPREAGQLPPDVPAELARADSASSVDSSSAAQATPPSQGSGRGFWWWGILLLGVAVLFLLWRARRRMDAPAAKPSPVSTGPVSKGGSDVPLFGTLGNYVNQKLGGKAYSPSLFRLGMAVTIDPTPFLLAESATKVKAPDTGSDRLVSIEAVGTVTSGPATVYRLHLPGGPGKTGGFFQIHLGPDGQPDECRYFTPIDSVAPSDEGEWGFWLDDAEGMIGWPEFQTKDGKLYSRVWQPGASRIQPFTLSEARQTVRGTETVVSQSMLYGAPTGAAAPAPTMEYILVEAVERSGRASVEIAAGIDVNPASLSLS